MRRATSAAVQRAARSSPDATSAPMNVPSGLGLRGQMWPLSIWVWQSTKQGRTMRPARSMAAEDGARVVRGDGGDLAVGDGEVGEDEAVGVERTRTRPGVSEACRRALASVYGAGFGNMQWPTSALTAPA